MEGGGDGEAGVEARDEAARDEAEDEPEDELLAAGRAGGAHAEPPLPRLSLLTRPVAGSVGELSMADGVFVNVVDGS